MRLFVAADLPAGVRAELAAHGRALADAGGWRLLSEESLHVTLAFLGQQDPEAAQAIATALAPAAVEVGEVALGRILRLPPRRPRVAAVEIEDSGRRLAGLQAEVVSALVALGVFEPERRRFLPHVTVARRSGGASGGTVDQPAWESGSFAPPSLTLYESRLSRSGARYEALATFAL